MSPQQLLEQEIIKSRSFTIDNYVATLHWGHAKDDFNSILTLYNYYGFAFRNHTRSQTDANVLVRFFDEDGRELSPYSEILPTGGCMHLSIGDVHPGFRGLVTAQMIPKGRMPRLKAVVGKPMRPIATSFFMLYQRKGGFSDFSHELFTIQPQATKGPVEWATILYTRPNLSAKVVVMNNKPLQTGKEFHSEVDVQLVDLNSHPLTELFQLGLVPGGSRVLGLSEIFPNFQPHGDSVAILVKGTNIEQPMSFHLHDSGDFNIHHF